VKNVREALSFVDAREAARLYISLGWYPIPLHPDTKKCRDDDWQKRGQLGERPDYVPEDFQPGDNVGIRLISAKDQYHTLKLVGVDLDCEEAVTAAKSFLPDSMAAWGRKSKAISQVLYVSEFEESIAHADQAAGKKMLCELRVDHQSMAPPSRHPNGSTAKSRADRDDRHGSPVLQPTRRAPRVVHGVLRVSPATRSHRGRGRKGDHLRSEHRR
jgi:hypothetical protein